MMIREISDAVEKSAICEHVLRALPAWFGIEASIVDYVEQVRTKPFYAAFEGDAAIGFAALAPHNAFTGEVFVMGVLPAHHKQGVGRQLIERCERACRQDGRVFLTVKTLDESAKSEEYARTRKFYQAMGFVPLEVFPLLWDAANPCLFLAKYLG